MSIPPCGKMASLPLVSYDMNARHSEGNGSTSDTAYMGLRYGLNMGPWRLRSRGNLNWDKDNGSKYTSQISIYSVILRH